MTGIPQGSFIFTPDMAKLAMQTLPISQTRGSLSRNTPGWKLLYLITECAFTPPIAANPGNGNAERQPAANPEELKQTVGQVSQRARLSPRTVRHHIAQGILKAHRTGRTWRIAKEDADLYVTQHRTL